MGAEGIGLSEVIETVRAELADAIARGAGQEVRFRSGKVTLELEMGTNRSADGSVGTKLWVLNLGLGGKTEQRRGHTITIELEPVFGDELTAAAARGDAMIGSGRGPSPGLVPRMQAK